MKRVALVLICAALGACRREAKKPPRIEPAVGESTVLPRRAPTAMSAPVTSVRTIEVGGRTRRFVLVEPSGASSPLPLVLVLHGDGGNASGFHQAWPFERATGDGAVLAYPDGEHATWDLETKAGNKDIAFLEAVVATLPVDRTRVFGAGYSSGGFMLNVLACHRPSLLRAFASNAGGAPYLQDETFPNGYPRCPGQKPVAMLALHGERDGAVTFDSGRFSAEYWAYVNGCQTDVMETTGYDECRLYRGCPAGKAVGLCTIGPLGHWVWERSAEASWTFFNRQ